MEGASDLMLLVLSSLAPLGSLGEGQESKLENRLGLFADREGHRRQAIVIVYAGNDHVTSQMGTMGSRIVW